MSEFELKVSSKMPLEPILGQAVVHHTSSFELQKKLSTANK